MHVKSQYNKPTHFTTFLIQSLYIAFSLILGILFAYKSCWEILTGYAILIAISLTSGFSRYNIACMVLVFAMGYARLCHVLYHYQQILNQLPKRATIIGVIDSIEECQHKQYRYTMLIDATHTQNSDQSLPNRDFSTPWRLQCYSNQTTQATIGDIVQLTNITITSKSTESFNDYLKKEGIHATTFLPSNHLTVLYHPSFHLGNMIRDIKYRILHNIQRKCTKRATTLISAIFFGNRLYVKHDYTKLKDPFCNWGILHFLARSGIHLVIFIFIIQFFLRYIPIHLTYKRFLSLGIVTLYGVLSWNSISFSRAYCTYLWYTLCNVAGLQINAAHIMITLSCLFLLVNPMLLFFLDYQLSFGITLILAMINQYLNTESTIDRKALQVK